MKMTIFKCLKRGHLFAVEEWSPSKPSDMATDDHPECPLCALEHQLEHVKMLLEYTRGCHARAEEREDKIRDALADQFGFLRSLSVNALCERIRTMSDHETCSRGALLESIAEILKISRKVPLGELPQWVQRFQDDLTEIVQTLNKTRGERDEAVTQRNAACVETKKTEVELAELRKALSFIAEGCVVDPPVAAKSRLVLAMCTARVALQQDDNSER